MDAQPAKAPTEQYLPGSAAGIADFERARAGDAGAFHGIVRAHQARVYSFALRLTGRREDAEELAQDVFVQLHGALPQIASAGHLKHWLLRTVSHRSIDRLRHESRRPRLVPIEALGKAGEPADEQRESDPLAGARLRQLLLELAPDARAALLLRFQEDLDPSEIADVLGMSVNTVKSHLRRSLEWLRAQLAGDSNGT